MMMICFIIQKYKCYSFHYTCGSTQHLNIWDLSLTAGGHVQKGRTNFPFHASSVSPPVRGT